MKFNLTWSYLNGIRISNANFHLACVRYKLDDIAVCAFFACLDHLQQVSLVSSVVVGKH